MAVLSFVALLDVCTLTFTPPLARLIASLLEIAINRIRNTAPPVASNGVFKWEYWLNDSRVGRMLLLGSTVILLLINSVWLIFTFSSSQCCSKIFMR